MIKVEVAFALPTMQKIIVLQVEEGTTVYEAVVKSKIVDIFPEIDVEKTPVGIFGKGVRKPKEEILKDGDRVEVYRPLLADPKEVRARRAAKKED